MGWAGTSAARDGEVWVLIGPREPEAQTDIWSRLGALGVGKCPPFSYI